MAKQLFSFAIGICALFFLCGNAAAQVNASLIGRYSIGNYTSAGGAAEISAYDPSSKRMFVINGPDSSLRIVNISNPKAPLQVSKISIKPYGIDLTSVAVKNGLVAVAVIDSGGKTNPSNIVFMDINGTFISKVKAGANADQVVFTSDGKKLLVANEGEPNVGYTIDPEGSVSIIDLTGGAASLTQANVQTASFTAFNSPTVLDPKIRVYGRIQSGGVFLRNSTVAEDMEPEYITISDDNSTAYVTCQENNCIAVVNINTATITSLLPLGFKNFNLSGNGLDPSDRDGAAGAASAKIGNWPVFGLFLPDGISSYSVGGQTYLVTANEGDARADWGPANLEEARVKDLAYVLDTAKFGGPAMVSMLKADSTLGRLTVTNRYGDFDSDGKMDSIFTFGGRSFTIWNATTGALVWDSKDEFEQRTLAMFPANFNTGHTTNSLDDRSDNKGPEPESVAVGKIGDSTYAFVGLERIGGVMIYNITNPLAPTFVQYINARNFSVSPSQGNLATVGDLGPEGIVFIPASQSPNGQNLIMVSNEVSATVSLFSVTTPETQNITKIQDYENKTSAPIGTYKGINFREAGFSSLFPIPNTNGTEFWTCSDRGVNVDCANANSASCRPTYDKMYAFPSYTPKIHRIRLKGDSIQIVQTISIKRPKGTGATGIINPTNLGSKSTEVASTDTVLDCANFNLKTTPKDTFGIDPEGMVVDKNGNFWLCEEGGATIWMLNSEGVLQKRYTPYANLAGKQSVDIQIDTVFKYRKNNRGFEGIAIAPNGKIYAMIQSGILYPNTNTGENSRVHRILEIDPATNAQRMLVYLNEGNIGAGGNQIRMRDWKIGDMSAINDSTFLVIEAGARGTSDVKRIYQINIAQATPVNSGLYGGVTLEALVDSTGLAAQGIKPVTKKLMVDLLASGWPAALDKSEGLAILNDSTIAVGNDNDFGQTCPLADGLPIATNNQSHVITYRLVGDKKLQNYQSAASAVSSQSAYLTPAAPGVKLNPILTTGDAINGYRLAGAPDGIGAYDNNDGTFTLLMNHEFGGTSGAIHAHGSKGAFVSKWIINKNDLTVASGSDLIKRVKVWNVATQQYDQIDSANASSKTVLNRFCSADLPEITAFYNATSGLGTQERIFMNGEEAGAEGRGFGHLATGEEAGTAYELPALGKFSWENAVASPVAQDKTIVVGFDDSTPGQVYVYVGEKTNAGSDVDKAGLTNGKLYGVAVNGLTTEISASFPAPNTRFAMADLGFVKDSTGASLNSRSNSLGVTNFLRPEDGAWDPSNPSDLYFVTTNAFASPSRMWRLRFDDITKPELGGSITAVLDGTEGQKMMDNIGIDKYGHVLIVEDVGGNAHLGKTWQYTIATDKMELVASHDSTRFISGAPNFLTIDEEASGIIDVEDILGAGNFLVVDQAHYSIPGELVEGGQLLKLFNPATAAGIAAKSIAQARATGLSDTVRTRGIVTRAWGEFIYIQDTTGAIAVHQPTGALVDSISSAAIKQGDLVEVIGVRGELNNYAHIMVANGAFTEKSRVTVLSRNKTLPVAKQLTISQLKNNGEQYESQLVRVIDLKTTATGTFEAGTNYTVWAGANTADTFALTILSAENTEIDDSPAMDIPQRRFDFTGTLTQSCGTPACTSGYSLQGVHKFEIIENPALGAFDLIRPTTDTTVVTSAGNTTPITFKWKSSANAVTYKWFITPTSGSFSAPWARLAFGSSTQINKDVQYFDTLAAKNGVAKGDTVDLMWTVYAYRGSDSIMAAQSNNFRVIRYAPYVPKLNPFNLLSQPNNVRLVVAENEITPIAFTWGSSANDATYSWLLDAQGGDFSNPWANIGSDSAATAKRITLTAGELDSILKNKAVAIGDSAMLIWTVKAYKEGDTLQANQTYNLKVVRKNTTGISEFGMGGALKLYPNPSSANTMLSIDLNSAEKIEVTVTDLQGKLVLNTMTKNVSAGNKQVELPTASLQNGVYLVNITVGNKSAQAKLVVIH